MDLDGGSSFVPNPGLEEDVAPRLSQVMEEDHANVDPGAVHMTTHRGSAMLPLAKPRGRPPSKPKAKPSARQRSPSQSSSDTEDDVALGALVTRSQGNIAHLACPVAGCHSGHYHYSEKALLSHLSRNHVAAGHLIPDPTLRVLRHSICRVCRSLFRDGTRCQCHANPIQGTEAPHFESPVRPLEYVASQPSEGTSLNLQCPSLEPVLAARLPTF